MSGWCRVFTVHTSAVGGLEKYKKRVVSRKTVKILKPLTLLRNVALGDHEKTSSNWTRVFSVALTTTAVLPRAVLWREKALVLRPAPPRPLQDEPDL